MGTEKLIVVVLNLTGDSRAYTSNAHPVLGDHNALDDINTLNERA